MIRFCLLILIVVASLGACAQSVDRDAPPVRAEAPYVQHKFFDAMNDSAIGLTAIPIIGDSLSTQRFLGTGMITEANPIARPFVSSRGGQAFISGVGFASVIGGMYLLHRLEGHEGSRHKKARVACSWLERSTPFIVSAVEFDRWHHNNVLIRQTNQCASSGTICQ